MDKIKTILDREQLSSQSIAERQNFKKVLSDYETSGGISARQKWIYGSIIGSAVVTGIIATTFIDWESKIDKPIKPQNVENVESPTQEQDLPAEVLAVSVQDANTTFDREKDIKTIPVNKKEEKVKEVESEPEPAISLEEEFKETMPQVESNASTVVRKQNNMPRIGSYYTGEIPLAILCNNEEIRSGSDLAIVSYVIAYYDGNKEIEQKIKGAAIPDLVCAKLGAYNLGVNVRITSIIAEDRYTGKQFALPSMSITPVNQ